MKRTKKESIVVFEDWFKYARCLNDAEFRSLMSAILNYYKTQDQPKFTGMLLEVWDDIKEDLEINVAKKQAKRNTMLRNAKSNPKLNIVPDIGPDTGSNTEPNTTGMVDGRLDMVDGGLKTIDETMDDRTLETMDEPNVEWFLHRLEMGEQYNTLHQQYPNSSSLSKAYDEYWDKF